MPSSSAEAFVATIIGFCHLCVYRGFALPLMVQIPTARQILACIVVESRPTNGRDAGFVGTKLVRKQLVPARSSSLGPRS